MEGAILLKALDFLFKTRIIFQLSGRKFYIIKQLSPPIKILIVISLFKFPGIWVVFFEFTRS
jgi:hypothetical protein